MPDAAAPCATCGHEHSWHDTFGNLECRGQRCPCEHYEPKDTTVPDLDQPTVAPCVCGCPATHHQRKEDGTLNRCLLDQCACMSYRPAGIEAFDGGTPPNRHVLPGAEAFTAPAGGPGQANGTGDANLADVLVNYDEIFQAVHMRHLQDRAVLVQENAELRAGFNQAVARMEDAEAKLAALRAIDD